MAGAWKLKRLAQDRAVVRRRGHHIREDGKENEQRDDTQAGRRQAVAEEAPPGVLPDGAVRRWRFRVGHLLQRRRRHGYPPPTRRTRGSTIPYRMSLSA